MSAMSWEGWDENGIYHVCEQPPVVEGSSTTLHRLWKTGDRVQTLDGRTWIVGRVGWNQLWCGVQSVVLHEFTEAFPDGKRHTDGDYYSRYVGCSPWALRKIGEDLPFFEKLRMAEMRAAAARATFLSLGPWLKQRDRFAKDHWQRARRNAAAEEMELMAMRGKEKQEEKKVMEDLELIANALGFGVEESEEEPVEL